MYFLRRNIGFTQIPKKHLNKVAQEWDRFSLCNPCCPGILAVDQAGLEPREPGASASLMEFKACATMLGKMRILLIITINIQNKIIFDIYGCYPFYTKKSKILSFTTKQF